MTISMYQASAPIFIRMLGNLRAILQKGAAHAEGKKFAASVWPHARLAPDMLALPQQIYIATDTAKGCVARLAGIEPPKYADTESTVPELVARIDKTLAFLKTIKPAQIDGSEDRDITLKFPQRTFEFKGQQYLTHFALPNFFFHVTTAYNILRHNGVELGKPDFIGGS